MKNREHEAWDCEITSCTKHYEVNNDKCHNFYYLVKSRIWTGRDSFFRRQFVVWFDTEELAEQYPDKSRFSKKDITEYARVCANSFLAKLPSKGEVTMESLKRFSDDCVESINRFNRLVA